MTHISSLRAYGMGSVVAVLSLSLVSAAVLALTFMLRLDVERTRDTRRQAQLQQMLLAGADQAQTLLRHADASPPSGEVDLVIPEALGAEARLYVVWGDTNGDDPDVTATVIAELAGTAGRQVLTWREDQVGRWGVISARLERLH